MAKRTKKAKFRTPMYYTWCAMKSRCLCPTNKSYPDYGGRGIKVCDRWLDYESFYKDMSSSWKKHKEKNSSTTLERIDNNGNYEPTNCRWATRQEQSNNRRHHNRITHKGKTMNIVQWAKEVGLKSSTLRQRYYVYKWSVKKCLETPLIKN